MILNEKDISVMETRLQADLYTYTDWAEFKFKGDVWADGVTEKGDGDVREGLVLLASMRFFRSQGRPPGPDLGDRET